MRYGIHPAPPQIPPLFRELSLAPETLCRTEDGFCASTRSLADILTGRGIETFPNARGEQRRCDLFFDDWYLYSIPTEGDFCYSLFKMREQEHNAERGEIGDGDTPGVTVCFIEFHPQALTACLANPSPENRSALNREINRVVADRGQRHHEALKACFRRPQAQAPYLIAELYVRFLAGLSRGGSLPVPAAYAAIYKRNPRSRLPRFLEANNANAGRTVCDHENIRIGDPEHPGDYEALALLATHTGNTSLHSFAAEVRFHACYLFALARFPIPRPGHTVYDSAVRADLTIAESALDLVAPFHNPRSHWIRQQLAYHGDKKEVPPCV
ncbi:MAG: hypothetical protein ACI4PL_05025 [Faecousia sp.]